VILTSKTKEKLAFRPSTPQQIAQRARIVLEAAKREKQCGNRSDTGSQYDESLSPYAIVLQTNVGLLSPEIAECERQNSNLSYLESTN